MGLQIVRNILLLKIEDWTWLKWKGWAALFCVPSLIYMFVTWHSWMDILPFIAYAVGTFAFWTNSAKMLRLSELVILGSVVVSIIRFGWKGLDDPDFK